MIILCIIVANNSLTWKNKKVTIVITKSYRKEVKNIVLNEQLATLVCVAEQGSFGKAAEKLFLSTPAVIKQMNVLEHKLGLRLFQRDNRGVTLTPAAGILCREAKILAQRFESAVEEARRAQLPERNVFRIGSSLFKPCQPFIELWNRLGNNFPNYTLQILPFDDDHNNITEIVHSLGKRMDFVVAACNSKLWLKQVNFCKLRDCRFCAAVPRHHVLAQKARLSMSDFYGETVLLYNKGDADSIDALWEEFSIHPKITVKSVGYTDIELFNQVSRSDSLIISLDIWENVHPSFVSLPVDWDFVTPYGLLYAKEPSADVQKFVTMVKTHFDCLTNV